MSPELIKYAERKVAGKRWRSGVSLPKGFEAPDLVGVVIEKILNGILGVNPDYSRAWNEKRYPTLIEQLKAAIDSECSNLVTSGEHKKTNYSAEVDAQTAIEVLETAISKRHKERSAEDILLEKEQTEKTKKEFKEFLTELQKAVAHNKDATLLLATYCELAEDGSKVKPQEVVEKTKMDIEKVRNAVRVVKRAANGLKEGFKKEVVNA